MSQPSNFSIPNRSRTLLYVVAVIFIFGYIALIFIEELSPIQALYFLIITISTVGYGDISPSTPISQLIVSILIVTGLSSVALLSERLVDRLERINTQQYLELPKTGLDYSGHVIIAGHNRIAKNIAVLFQERFFRVVIIDQASEHVIAARNEGFEAYLGDIESEMVLTRSNMEEASVFYLFMPDENTNVVASIQARSLNDDLLIYAATDHELSIELGKLIGIDRTYHYERIVASNIQFSLRQINALTVPNQMLTATNHFVLVLVSERYPYKDRFPDAVPIGFLDSTFTMFDPLDSENIDETLAKGNFLTIAVPRTVYVDALGDDYSPHVVFLDEEPTNIKNIIIGGYNDVAEHVLEEIDEGMFENINLQIFVFSEEEAEKARKHGFNAVICKREDLHEQINMYCTEDTLIVNLFDRITDSLLMNTLLKDVGVNVTILQLAYNEIEIEVFIKSGVNRILIPDILMSRGMFLIYVSTKKLYNSFIWGNAHVFEHLVDSSDPLKGKNYRDINKMGYHILLHTRASGEQVVGTSKQKVEIGDHLILHADEQFVSRGKTSIVDDIPS